MSRCVVCGETSTVSVLRHDLCAVHCEIVKAENLRRLNDAEDIRYAERVKAFRQEYPNIPIQPANADDATERLKRSAATAGLPTTYEAAVNEVHEWREAASGMTPNALRKHLADPEKHHDEHHTWEAHVWKALHDAGFDEPEEGGSGKNLAGTVRAALAACIARGGST